MKDKRANFERISRKRKLEIITLISKLTNLSNKYFYECSREELTELFDEIQECLTDTRKKVFDEYKILGGKKWNTII